MLLNWSFTESQLTPALWRSVGQSGSSTGKKEHPQYSKLEEILSIFQHCLSTTIRLCLGTQGTGLAEKTCFPVVINTGFGVKLLFASWLLFGSLGGLA